MNTTSEPTTDSAEKPAIEGLKRVNALLRMMDHWKTRVEALGLKRESDEYFIVQNEFWMGALLMANALGHPQSPILVIYLMARRDILSLEGPLKEQLLKELAK